MLTYIENKELLIIYDKGKVPYTVIHVPQRAFSINPRGYRTFVQEIGSSFESLQINIYSPVRPCDKHAVVCWTDNEVFSYEMEDVITI